MRHDAVPTTSVRFVAILLFATALCVSAVPGQQPQTVETGRIVSYVTDDAGIKLTAKQGSVFVWLRVGVASGTPVTFDLKGVSLIADNPAELAGIDVACGHARNEPPKFKIVTFVDHANGTTSRPMTAYGSAGDVAFSMEPGGASLRVKESPAAFCLLFVLPATAKPSSLTGFGATSLVVPALAR